MLYAKCSKHRKVYCHPCLNTFYEHFKSMSSIMDEVNDTATDCLDSTDEPVFEELL